MIITGLASAAGTFILQRPLTDPEQMQRTYSPQTLRWLDTLALTDVFHSWWFISLLGLLAVNIILASVERFPEVWRYFARPYRRPEPHFLKNLPAQREIVVREPEGAIEAAERAFRKLHFKPQRVGPEGSISLFAERNRFGRLGAYVVHASLLTIFAGGIIDGVKGYRGYVQLSANQQSNQIELRDGKIKQLPFEVRCEGAGQENYPDGTPKRWWSKLVVVEGGREVMRKEIEVNEPLVYGGIRFFQSSYGASGEARSVRLSASPRATPDKAKDLVLGLGDTAELDPATTVRLMRFVPDFAMNGKEIVSRSNQPNNPAIQLIVNSRGTESKVWIFPKFPEFSHPDESGWNFRYKDLELDYFTGLQVAYEPGQWGVWIGAVLLSIGLAMAFYMVHMRFWVVPVSDDRGRTVLWVGASASKNRDEFEARFERLVNEIEAELNVKRKARAAKASVEEPVSA